MPLDSKSAGPVFGSPPKSEDEPKVDEPKADEPKADEPQASPHDSDSNDGSLLEQSEPVEADVPEDEPAPSEPDSDKVALVDAVAEAQASLASDVSFNQSEVDVDASDLDRVAEKAQAVVDAVDKVKSDKDKSEDE